MQYIIEKLFQIRKDKFKAYPGVIPDLDLVEESDRITHNFSLEDEIDQEENLNVFAVDKDFDAKEQEWELIKKEIVGDYFEQQSEESSDVEPELTQPPTEQIEDMTEQDMIKLRKTIYLVIMSSIDFEECCHKLLKLKIRPG